MAEWESPQGLELRNGKREVGRRISSKKNNYFIKRNVGIREMIPNGAIKSSDSGGRKPSQLTGDAL